MKRFVFVLLAILLGPLDPAAAVAPAPGFLVAAPDRGFTGNEDIREAFEEFAVGRDAELVFVTDERVEPVLARALRALDGRGAVEVVVLPLFLSEAEWRFDLLRRSLEDIARSDGGLPPIRFAPAFGASYLAVEALAERLRAGSADRGPASFLIVGTGARTAEQGKAIAAELERIAGHAASDLVDATLAVHVWVHGESEDAADRRAREARTLAARLADLPGAVVVPFHLGRKLDRMMSFDAELRVASPEGAAIAGEDTLTPALFSQWLGQAANRHLPLAGRDLGVVVHAHGADWHWNQTLREAARPLEDDYLVEYAFSMGDQATIERAVQRLQARGARAAVVVRVFGLAGSFRAGIERMLGIDVDSGRPPAAAAAHAGHRHGPGVPEPRIRAAIPMTTVGGLEDDPLFARALLERALAISSDPSRETLVLVAHGSGDDRANARWNELLESLVRQIRALGGDRFRAIHAGTWREDWPKLREPAVAHIRGLVSEAAAGGGTALVVPARTNGRGPEERFLDGLQYRLAEGFAPHPLFAEWLARQVELGRTRLRRAGIGENPILDAGTAVPARDRAAEPAS